MLLYAVRIDSHFKMASQVSTCSQHSKSSLVRESQGLDESKFSLFIYSVRYDTSPHFTADTEDKSAEIACLGLPGNSRDFRGTPGTSGELRGLPGCILRMTF